MPDTFAPRVYLAGPMVFYPDLEATFDVMKTICEQEGLEGVALIDGQISSKASRRAGRSTSGSSERTSV